MKNIIIMLIVVIIYTWVDDKGVTNLTNYTPPEGAIVLMVEKNTYSWSSNSYKSFPRISFDRVKVIIKVPKPQVIIVETVRVKRKSGRKSFHDYSYKRDHWERGK